jgi:hypothetical protein
MFKDYEVLELLNFSTLNRFDQQWLYCGFRGPYSCGAAGEFPERLKGNG